MASTPNQRKRAYDGQRLGLIHERLRASCRDLADAIRLAETEDVRVRHQPNGAMILKYADRALILLEVAVTWAEELVWKHEREKAERVEAAGGDAA